MTLYFVGLWFRIRRPKTLKIQVFRFIPDGTKIPFMKISRYAIVFSVIISLLAIGSAFTKGFNLGIEGSTLGLTKYPEHRIEFRDRIQHRIPILR